MTIQTELDNTMTKLSEKGKGILAADESTNTITKRFGGLNIESTEESRRAYREMLLTTPGVNEFISGVILFEETLNQKTSDGMLFADKLKKLGILPGIKVDKGLVNLPFTNEQTTQGLDGLSERLQEYKNKGAVFAKWRATYSITEVTPSELAIQTNAESLARYAAICQANGIVPIVEPEVLIDGAHSLDKCFEVSERVFHAVFHALHQHKVMLEQIVLKPSMVISGKNATQKASVDEVAKATITILKRTVPSAVRTINFLSGGQSPEEATAHLNAMHTLFPQLPWNVSFSYARALQDYAMKTWKGDANKTMEAQKAFYQRAKLNSLASVGEYTPSMEKELSFA